MSIKSWNMALACFISGILIDLDHIYDYVREYGFPFKVKNFFKAVHSSDIPKLTLVLHSWELLFLLGMAALSTNWDPWTTGILIGFGHHIVLDKINNGERLRTYSFLWRWKHNFEFVVIFPNVAKKKMQD